MSAAGGIEARDELAARIVHTLTCTRCRMDWTCGGLSEDDYGRAARIAPLIAEARAEAYKVERLAAVAYGNPDGWCRFGGMNRAYWRRVARRGIAYRADQEQA